MHVTGTLSRRLAITVFLLASATVAVFWVASTQTSLAGDDSDFAYAYATGLGSRAFLGVHLEEEIDHPEGGARIAQVVDDSAAEAAGLEEGDIIVGFDGDTIRGPKAVTKRMEGLEPGDPVSITVLRDGRKRSFDVELGKRAGAGLWHVGEDDSLFVSPMLEGFGCDDDDEDCSFSWNCTGDDCDDLTIDLGRFFGRRPMLGVQLVHVTNELREHLGGEAGTGVLVSKIVSNSPAVEAGIEVGDLIVEVAGEPIEGASDIREALEGTEGESFDVEVIREGRTTRLEVTIPEVDDDNPTGPRAYRYRVAPHIDMRGIQEQIDGAMDEVRDALREAGSS